MAVKKLLARGWKFEVENSATPAVFVVIKGIHNFSVTAKKNDAETTTFEDLGRETHVVASRGTEMSLEGIHLEDPATGMRDPGQEEVESVADLIDDASLRNFRLTSPGKKAWTFLASASVEGPGGGNNDSASWKAALKVSGTITKVTLP